MTVYLINFIDAKITEREYAVLRVHPWLLMDECRIGNKLFKVDSVEGEWVRINYTGGNCENNTKELR